MTEIILNIFFCSEQNFPQKEETILKKINKFYYMTTKNFKLYSYI